MSLQVRAGVVPGRYHILDARNCQDALWHMAFEIAGKSYHVGIIADGCGEGRYSETGAQLAVQFIPLTVRNLLQQECAVEDVPTLLFGQLLAFLKGVVDGYAFADMLERMKFVHSHLLFTLVGFIVAPEETLVFAAGDGVVLINDERYMREQNNTPTYIGYHLIDQHYLQSGVAPLPGAFDLYRIPTQTLTRLAVGSDAWLQEQDLLEQVWGNRTVAGLQLSMNRWSDARHFKDDASMILVERETHSETGSGA